MDAKLSTENLLNLKKPESYTCYVFHFNKSHSQLLIDVFDPKNDKRIRVHFSDVLYFSGELRWTGANFRVNRIDRGLDLLKRLEWYSTMTSDVLERLDVENLYKYYEVTRNFDPIIILASSMEISA